MCRGSRSRKELEGLQGTGGRWVAGELGVATAGWGHCQVDWAPGRQGPGGVEQSRESSVLRLTGSPGCCGEGDGSRARAEAGTRQEATAPVQACWWRDQGGSPESRRSSQIWANVKVKDLRIIHFMNTQYY